MTKTELLEATLRRPAVVVGDKHGFLTAVAPVGRRISDVMVWRWLCDCGATVEKAYSNVKHSGSRSCGCMTKALQRSAMTQHGHSIKLRGSPTFATFICWQAMWWRCGNAARADYKHYGGRGIAVCDRWKDYEAFLADMGLRPAGKSIDRIDVNGNYEPGNCRWASTKEQARNRRTNFVFEALGKRQCLVEWAEELGIPRDTLARRVRKWGPELAVSRPYTPNKSATRASSAAVT